MYANQKSPHQDVVNVPIAMGFCLMTEMMTVNEKGYPHPFKTFIMPSPYLHVKYEDIFMYDNQEENYLLPSERHLKANTYWLPYYPWMWFARRAIMEFGVNHNITVTHDLALKVTDYFM